MYLVVIGKSRQCLIQPHTLELLVVGINPEDLKLSGRDANIRL